MGGREQKGRKLFFFSRARETMLVRVHVEGINGFKKNVSEGIHKVMPSYHVKWDDKI
jgi:hypothetical protein